MIEIEREREREDGEKRASSTRNSESFGNGKTERERGKKWEIIVIKSCHLNCHSALDAFKFGKFWQPISECFLKQLFLILKFRKLSLFFPGKNSPPSVLLFFSFSSFLSLSLPLVVKRF